MSTSTGPASRICSDCLDLHRHDTCEAGLRVQAGVCECVSDLHDRANIVGGEGPDSPLRTLRQDRDYLLNLLSQAYLDLHPVTANTSRSGGIGGSAITTHCVVAQGAHTLAETALVAAIERAIYRPQRAWPEPVGGEVVPDGPAGSR